MFDFGSSIPSLTPTETAGKIAAPNVAFIDVRSVPEYRSGHAQGAKNIPLETIGSSVDTLKTLDAVYVICQSGGRSARATSELVNAHVNAINVSGGTLAWRSEGLPIE